MTKTNKLVFWIPRVISILFVLFIAMFSLDVFDGSTGFWGTALALLMHNIPTLIISVLVYYTWKFELLGAILFGLVGISSVVRTIIAQIMHPNNVWPIDELMMFIAFITMVMLTSILYYISWKQKKRR